MSLARVTETSATSSPSIEDAIRQGLERATRTLRGVTSAWIKNRQVKPGSPEALFAAPDRPSCFAVTDRGREKPLLRGHWVEIASAAWRGLPVIVALQSPAEAVWAEAWLRELRLDWSVRHSRELRDALEARGLLPNLAERAKAG
jgi:hypothetical protein